MEPEYCPHCGAEAYPAWRDCPQCGEAVGFPNVRLAKREAGCLADRLAQARANPVNPIDQESEKRLRKIIGDSHVVISVLPSVAVAILTFKERNIVPRETLEQALQLAPASPENTSRREMVEARVFPGFGHHIVYGALSPDGRGLANYGCVYLVINSDHIRGRTSFLESNSFDICNRKNNTEKNENDDSAMIETGFRAAFDNLGDLALVKINDNANINVTDEVLKNLILSSGKDRSEDKFIESHTWSFISPESVIKYYLGPPPVRGQKYNATNERNQYKFLDGTCDEKVLADDDIAFRKKFGGYIIDGKLLDHLP